MPDSQRVMRYVAFVDGTWFTEDGARGKYNGTPSTIYRLYAATKEGIIKADVGGREIVQKRKYYPGIGANDHTGKKIREGVWGDGCKKQIKEVYQDACRELSNPEDELWLYGYSRGAYVVRAVAGLLHHMGCISAVNATEFDQCYKETLRLYLSVRDKDIHRGGAIHHHFASPRTRVAPTIKFVGAFDTVKALDDASLHDISLNASTQHFRHAVALNERRKDFAPEVCFPFTEDSNYGDRTAIEAWFLGTHSDLGGGNSQDGLSLYPLQWMLTESRSHGLQLEFRKIKMDVIDDPLELCLPRKNNTWSCRLENGILIEMCDLQVVHNSTKQCSSYGIRLNMPSSGWIIKAREPFEVGRQSAALKGYNKDVPRGTIVHPSVYLIFDCHPQIWGSSRDLGYRNEIELFRSVAIPKTDDIFWDQSPPQQNMIKEMRVLVCGNTGVGKSTLINRVFGVTLTEEDDIKQGKHDINLELRWENKPGLVIHDSCGFAAGDTSGTKKLKKFLQARSGKAKIDNRLHMIWFCIEMTTKRVRQEAIEETFRLISQYATLVPVILVGTKMDEFYKLCELDVTVIDATAKQLRFEERREQIESALRDIPCRFDVAEYIAKDDPDSIGKLVSSTLKCFDSNQVRNRMVAINVINLDDKIDLAVSTTMRYYKHAVRWASVPIPGVGITTQLSIAYLICRAVVESFGFTNIDPPFVERIVTTIVLKNSKRATLMILGETLSLVGLIFAPFGGAVLSTVQALASVPATASAVLMCACDVILVLERAFHRGQKRIGPSDLERAAADYQSTSAEAVHAEAIELAGKIGKVWTAFQFARIGVGVEQILARYRVGAKQVDSIGLEKESKVDFGDSKLAE
ncbi:hypothetical protein MMC17_001333 [Xylographa soralifera]|nr:hypothetical protein [Xylographa soralifera]